MNFLLIGVIYFGAHKIALLFPDTEKILAAIWPAGGIGLAALLLNPRRRWPAIIAVLFLAGNSANLTSGRPLFNSVGFMTANILESLGCAWLITKWCGESVRFCRIKEILALIVSSTAVNACSAMVGAGTAALAGVSGFGSFWLTWWISDGLGILIVTPLIVSWSTFRGLRLKDKQARALESALFLAIWCFTAWWVFKVDWVPFPVKPGPYVIVMLSAWACLRLSMQVLSLSSALLAGIAIASDAVTIGPLLWGGSNPAERVLLMQMYLGAVAFSSFLLYASHSEAREAHELAEDLAAIVSSSQESIVAMDTNGMITNWNSGAERLYGYKANEVLGKHISMLIPEGHFDQGMEFLNNALAGEKVDQYETVRQTKDGRLLDLSITLSPILDENGRQVGASGIARDITYRKQAENAQVTVLLRQKLAMDLAKLVHWEYDVLSDIFTFNDQFYALYGTTAAEQGGYQMSAQEYASRFLLPEDIPLVGHAVEQSIATSDPNFLFQLEHMITRTDGQKRFIEVRFAIIKDESGRTIKTYGANQDITDRKQAENELKGYVQELARRNRFIETILENLPIGLAVNYINEGDATYMNRKFEEIYGWPKKELEDVAKFFEKVYPDPAYRAEIQQRILSDINSGDPDRMVWNDIIVTGKDGSQRIVSAKNIPLFEQNLMISTVQDYTEHHRLEQQFRQAQKMEALGTLSGGIAHDFNNILGAVLGYAEIARDDARDGRTDPHDLDQIIASAQRAKGLVKQILTFSRKNEPALQPVNLNQAIKRAQSILERTLPKMIAIEDQLASELPPVLADPTQIEQVLLNLASNAADAMPDGGRLVLTTGVMTADESFRINYPEVPSGNYVLLTVSDTGLGMDQKTREHIFEPFFTTKEIGRGTGLGLSTVYGIVKAHGGFIYCHSDLGEGTTFSIYMPVRAVGQTASETEASADAGAGPFGSETILLVDDEEALRSIAARVLLGAGYRVLEAGSGEEALNVFAEQPSPPDLVITDLGMPGMGGHKAMLELFSRDPWTKVVIASGYAAQTQVKASLEAGAAAYVAKPFKKAELLVTVRSVLDRNKHQVP